MRLRIAVSLPLIAALASPAGNVGRAEEGPKLIGPILQGPIVVEQVSPDRPMLIVTPQKPSSRSTAVGASLSPIMPRAEAVQARPEVVEPVRVPTSLRETNSRETIATPRAEPMAAAHPLDPALEIARWAAKKVEALRDYQCVLVKREHVGGKLRSPETFALKVRHEPTSMYVQCLGPAHPRGREILYVEGHNNGLALVHTPGMRTRNAANTTVEINSARLLAESRHPLLDYSLERFAHDVVTEYEHESKFGECNVKIEERAQADDRPCVMVQVTHPQPRNSFRYHVTRVYFDRQWQVPVRLEAYAWPTKAGAQPQLIEERTYRKVVLDAGLKDADFDARNPAYRFR